MKNYPGFHIPNPEDCRTFYKCQKNHAKKGGYEAFLEKCPKGTGFNTKLGHCDHLSYLPLTCVKGLQHFIIYSYFFVKQKAHCPTSNHFGSYTLKINHYAPKMGGGAWV